MERYVVVSSNNNLDYLFYAPYLERAWNSLGWDLCVMVTSDVNHADLKLSNPETKVFTLPDIEGLRKESIAQAGRLYASNYFKEDVMLMTSDIDLLPMSDYWYPKENNITSYGHDLTDYTYLPMGYMAMISPAWRSIMKLTGDTKADIERDADEYKHMAKGLKWEEYWDWDWTMLTDRLASQQRGQHITHIKRGRQSNGFAFGRIDRGNSMAHVEGELIDCHCENNNVMHPIKLNRFLEIFEARYGKL